MTRLRTYYITNYDKFENLTKKNQLGTLILYTKLAVNYNIIIVQYTF